MRSVGVLEAKTNLSALVEEVKNGGEPVSITRHGKPVAKLVSADAEVLAPGRRKVTGAELLDRLHRTGEILEREAPEIAAMSWEELKVIARS